MKTETLTDKVIFALAGAGEGTAEQMVRCLERFDPAADAKPVVAEYTRSDRSRQQTRTGSEFWFTLPVDSGKQQL